MTSLRTRIIYIGGTALLIILSGLATAYFIITSTRVSVDMASIEAPLISLMPSAPGHLGALYVHTGDTVAANQPVALVGTQVITSRVAGLIVAVDNEVGAEVGADTAVVTMIDPTQLRVVGSIDENKGLAQIRVGDPVTFTVDAFGGQTFTGIIDEIAPTSNQSGIVFNISDQRQVQQFDVKARFDTSAYPELRNGMSARMVIYTR
ncbi:MAG TPA: efflux RND transporter periplasmic adaptor subunit [Candidatus Paceibacterota bacterium]|nr:efflux RND transporter periplasmic adaptor subunit [Candidatus Paceibacterota bacterium]